MSKSLSVDIWNRMRDDNKRFYASDNISEYVTEDVKSILIDEATVAAEAFLRTLLIDVENDPNSQGTARRLAKMYYNEIMSGRYEPSPTVTAFPNTGEDAYSGMLVVRADIRSMCSHHHQNVSGTAFIGILPDKTVLGLSKYIRIAQHMARRGTLQEELCQAIRKRVSAETNTTNVAVYIEANHGCCEHRGVSAHSSLTQTCSLGGLFLNDLPTKEEFFHHISMQKQ